MLLGRLSAGFCLILPANFPKLSGFSAIVGSFLDDFLGASSGLARSWCQDGPQTPPRRLQDRFQFPFGSIWGHMGVDLGPGGGDAKQVDMYILIYIYIRIFTPGT